MRRKLFIGVALLAAATIQAAPPAFEVTAPTWTKLAVSKNPDGVNIRKAPSTSAPKMIYNESKIEAYDVPLVYYVYWSTAATKAPLYNVPFTGPGAVIAEEPGWLQVKNIGPKAEENGWVSAKYCDVVSPVAMQYPSTPASNNFIWLMSGENGADGVYGLYLESDEMNGIATFYFGRLVNGMLVCPYRLFCDNFGTDEGKTRVEPYSDSYQLLYNPATEGDEYEVALNKFNSELIHYIIEHATPAPEKVIYLYDGYYSVADL